MGKFDNGNTFSVMDSLGMNTLAFQINENFEDGNKISSIEKLKFFTEQVDDGLKKTFFFNPDIKKDERKELLFLTLKKGEAVLNGAEFFNGRLNVGKKPGVVKYAALKSGDKEEYREFKYAPNFKRPISIIDPEIADEVKPVVFFDTETNNVKAKIKLQPHKSYIAIEIVD